MNMIAWIAGVYLLALVTWLFYVAIMHLKMVRHSLHPFAKINAYILLAVGLPLDALTNIVVGSLLFLEPPKLAQKEWLLTTRLERHKKHGYGWRKNLAMWMCANLLDQFDDGNHC